MNLYEKAKRYETIVRLTKTALDLKADIREMLNSLIKDINALKPNETSLQNVLLSALQNPSFGDTRALIGAVNKAYSLIPATPDHEPQKQNALDLSKKLTELSHQQTSQNTTEPIPSAVNELPKTKPQSEVKSYPKISSETQKMLNELLFTSAGGNYVPIVPDGKLGPDTKRALDMFAKEFNTSPTEEMVKTVHDLMTQIK